MSCRHFPYNAWFTVFCATVAPAQKSPPRIVFRPSWHTMNTGGQTPGVPALLEKHLRDAEVSLWPANGRHSVTERVQRWFAKLLFVDGAEA